MHPTQGGSTPVRRWRWRAALYGAVLVACQGEGGPTEGNGDARVVAQAVARPSATSPGAAFDIEFTATNVTSAPIGLTVTSGCAFSYEVQTPSGQVVASPGYFCTAVIRQITLAAGEVLRESYRYETGDFSFPRLEPGRYRVVPTLNVRAIPGLVVRAADIEIR